MAVNLGSAFATLDFQLAGLRKSAAEAQAIMRSVQSTANQTSAGVNSSLGSIRGGFAAIQGLAGNLGSAFSSVAGSIQPVISGFQKMLAVGSAGFTALMGFGFKFASQLQVSAAQMQALTGSTQLASSTFKQLYDFARGTPFAFPDVAKAAATLMGYGRTAQQVTQDIKTLGGLVAITGANWQNLAVVFGQVNAAGRLMGQDALQLINNGVPITAALAKQLGISIQEVKQRMEDGAITADMFNKAMVSLVPPDAIDRLSKTMPGALSNLTGSLRVFAFALIGIDYGKFKEGEPLLEKQGGLFQLVRENMLALSKAISSPQAKAGMEALGNSIANVAKTAIPQLIAGAQFVIHNFKTITSIIGGITAAFGFAKFAAAAFNLVVKANPLVLLAYAITAVVGALASMAIKSGALGKVLSHIQPTLDLIGQVINGLWKAIVSYLQPAIDKMNGSLNSSMNPLTGVNQAIRWLYYALLDLGKFMAGVLKSTFEILWPVIKSVGNLFLEIGKTVVWLAPIVGPILVGALQLLAGVIKWVADALSWFLKGLRDGNPVAVAIATVIGAVLVPALVLLGVNSAVTQAKAVAAWVKMQVEAVKTGATYVAQGARMIASLVSSAASHALNAAKIVGSWVLMGTQAVLQGAKIAAVWAGQALLKFLSFVVTTGIQAALVIGSWVLMAVGAMANAVIMAAAWFVALGPIGWVIAAVVGLVALIVTHWQQTKDVTTAVFSAIGQFLGWVWNGIKAVVTAIVGAIVWYITNYVNTILAIWKGLGALAGWIGGFLGNVFNTVVGVFTSIINWIKGAVSWFFNLGKDIIEGILNGIKNVANKVVDFIKNLFGDVVGIAKKILHIGSPSRVFADIGMNTMLGYVNGISNMAGDVKAALQSTMNPSGVGDYASSLASAAAGGIGGLAVDSSGNNVHTGDVVTIDKVVIEDPVGGPADLVRGLKLARAT